MTTKATVTYLLSEEGRKKSLLSGGDGKEIQTIDVAITPEFLSLALVDSHGVATLHIGDDYALSARNTTEVAINYRPGYGYSPHLDYKGTSIRFDAPRDAEALIAFEANRRAHIAARKIDLQPELDRLMAEYEEAEAKKAAEKAAKKAAEATERETRLAAEQAVREALEADKIAWVTTHGSDYLRDAVNLGYDCQRQYVIERVNLEFPDFQVDFKNQAGWKSRSCPSPEALADVKSLIANGYQAEVVWLTYVAPAEDGDEDDYSEDDFEPCEAVVIRDYLGKYDLIKVL